MVAVMVVTASGGQQMTDTSPQRWLEWAREIQALAQTGLHYPENGYLAQRYQHLIEIAAEMVSESSQLSNETIISTFNSQNGYATPRVDVRGTMFHEGKLLMVKERLDGGWTMPGGWAQPRYIADAFTILVDSDRPTVFD